MGIKKWLNNQIAAISLAFSNVEKNFLNQDGKAISETSSQEQRHSQGTLADALIHGEVTQEVKNLRWRTYKILRESANSMLIETEIDEYGNKYYSVQKKDIKKILNKLKVDSVDNYAIDMVFYNPEITSTVSEKLEFFTEDNKIIDSTTYAIKNKNNVPLIITRTSLHRFDIEKYTKKLVVRKIDDNKRLLEFYVSKYGIPENPTSKHFSRELSKLLDNTLIKKDFLDIKEVAFVSDNTIGTINNLMYHYEIESFDKIIEFDGNYVLKFFANVLVNGVDLLDEFVEKDLEEKYRRKESKNKL